MGCSLTTEYPFIKYIPIAIVMSISHVRYCATICLRRERETVVYNHWVAPDAAMTSNGDNDTPVQPQSERDSEVRREAVAGNGGGCVRTTQG